MYEDKTYESILADMLSRVPETLDRREGSVIWMAIAPAAAALAEVYIQLAEQFDEGFGDTAGRENLKRIAADTRGMTPKAATAAEWNVEAAPASISLMGERLASGALIFEVVATGDVPGAWIARCETKGISGNTASGELVPVCAIDGLESCSLASLLVPGTDEEDTEAFRARWRQSFSEESFGGNKVDYKEKIKSMDGIGGCKVYRAQNAAGEKVGGHVRCVILGADGLPPTQALVTSVQAVLDPTGDGEGDGIAPIGHICHVRGASADTVNFSAVYTIESGKTFADVKTQIEAAAETYLAGLRAQWEATDKIIVRLQKLVGAALDVPGVIDISAAKINGAAANFTAQSDSVPVLGTVEEEDA